MSRAIERIPTRISPDILDTIGKSFKFKHGKGVSEWLKNSLDNYLRLVQLGQEHRSGSWPVVLHLIDGDRHCPGPNLAVLDFGGTSFSVIQEFFLYWGDRTAARLGGTIETAVTGGHGNGGKFYMREMWKDGARFLTWRSGRASSLIVERASDGTTGYWEIKDDNMTWRNALAESLPSNEGLGGASAIIDHLEAVDPKLIDELDAGERGFTVVAGRRAEKTTSSNDVVTGRRWDHQQLIEDIRDAPQSRRPIRELTISVMVNGVTKLHRLHPDDFEEDSSWPAMGVDVPGAAISRAEPSIGHLRLRSASLPLTGKRRHLNSLFVLDASGNPIATYAVKNLPIPGHSPYLDFMQAELQLDYVGVDNLIENDREQLVSTNAEAQLLLEWVGRAILDRVKSIEESQAARERRTELEMAAVLNDALNEHAKRFLQELRTQIFVDFIDDVTGGGPGEAGTGVGPTGEGSFGEGQRDRGVGGNQGTGGTLAVPGSTQELRRPRFPQVLLSGHDADPSKTDGTSKFLTDRHPPLDQDDTDRMFNVWWINTEHPFAKQAITHGGPKGSAFKSYQLFMFRDVVQREALRFVQRRESELGLDRVENALNEYSDLFLTSLPRDLVEELLG
jgi:hypothetical protein